MVKIKKIILFARGELVSTCLILVAALLVIPFRSQVSIATTALILVVPVVIGVSIGGSRSGIYAAVIGFLVYDFLFIPPYYTFIVGAAQNYVALFVYLIVTLVVARVFSRVRTARLEADQKAFELRKLFDISEMLVRDSSPEQLLTNIVDAILLAFDLDSSVLYVFENDQLVKLAQAGSPLTDEESDQLYSRTKIPLSTTSNVIADGKLYIVPLISSDGPIGMLAIKGKFLQDHHRDLLQAFLNHLALALERSRLKKHEVEVELYKEMDNVRNSLMGAVSHDLKSPLTTISVASSALIDPESDLTKEDAENLARLIESQARRLNRLVTNLIDMTRIHSGALALREEDVDLLGLIRSVIERFNGQLDGHEIILKSSYSGLKARIDKVLIAEVLSNLIDNAIRYGPALSEIGIGIDLQSNDKVVVSVIDLGQGIPASEANNFFHMFNKREAGGRGGLGLAICKAFIDAHNERIWIETTSTSNSFRFTIPISKETHVRWLKYL